VANYFTPSGKSIPEEGVAPTVNVDGDDFRNDFYGTIPPREQDRVLQRALEIVRGRSTDAPAKAAQQCERALPLAG